MNNERWWTTVSMRSVFTQHSLQNGVLMVNAQISDWRGWVWARPVCPVFLWRQLWLGWWSPNYLLPVWPGSQLLSMQQDRRGPQGSSLGSKVAWEWQWGSRIPELCVGRTRHRQVSLLGLGDQDALWFQTFTLQLSSTHLRFTRVDKLLYWAGGSPPPDNVAGKKPYLPYFPPYHMPSSESGW